MCASPPGMRNRYRPGTTSTRSGWGVMELTLRPDVSGSQRIRPRRRVFTTSPACYRQPRAVRGVSQRRPLTEFLGVSHYPDIRDAPFCDREREHRVGDAVLLSDKAGLAIDRAFQDRHGGPPAGEVDAGARNLLGAFNWFEPGAGKAATVCDPRRAGVEEPNKGADVMCLPCALEVPDDAGLFGRWGRGRL